jgi:hypothetical protein
MCKRVIARQVVFNQRSGYFVMWFNWIAAGDFSKSFYATLTSQSPRGPFQLANKQVPMVSDENHEMCYASLHRPPHMFAGIF